MKRKKINSWFAWVNGTTWNGTKVSNYCRHSLNVKLSKDIFSNNLSMDVTKLLVRCSILARELQPCSSMNLKLVWNQFYLERATWSLPPFLSRPSASTQWTSYSIVRTRGLFVTSKRIEEESDDERRTNERNSESDKRETVLCTLHVSCYEVDNVHSALSAA